MRLVRCSKPRIMTVPLGAILVFCMLVATSCKKRQAPVTDTAQPPPLPSKQSAECEKDDDCGPMNCCFAVAEDSCIVKSRSTCEANAMKTECGAQTGPRY